MSDVDAAVKSGATSLGFIFVPGKRTASNSFAAEVSEAHPALGRVGVVQNLSADEIFGLIKETSITSLQFHGSETLEFVAKLRTELNSQHRLQSLKANEANLKSLSTKRSNIGFIRALDVDETLTREMIASWSEIVDVILFDSPRSIGPREHARAPLDVTRLAALLNVTSLPKKFTIVEEISFTEEYCPSVLNTVSVAL